MADLSARVPAAPQGWQRLKWLGPGFLWMVSAAGSGELLFTPRIGALYGYTLVWALLAAVALKWFINREIGRFTVCTGTGLLEGFSRLSGPRHWALWLILIPQLFVAVTTIAGLAGSAATALVLVLPGPLHVWTIGAVLSATALVLWGRYQRVEQAATALALVLAGTSLIAALSVAPQWSALAAGLRPQAPPRVDYGEVLPWLGFMLSGAAGMMWYSYWVKAKGYGLAATPHARLETLDATARERLRGWLRQMTLDNSVAVIGTLVVTLAFLILGVELLRPEGLVPAEDQVAAVLGRLLGDVWGPAAFWFMVLAVFIGFWDTVLSDQDGFGRMFASGAALLGAGANEERLRQAAVIVIVTALPLGLYLWVGQPVSLLKLAGAIEAAHIPVVTGLTLYLNQQRLPADLRASPPVFWATALAGIFFAAFALLYIGGLRA